MKAGVYDSSLALITDLIGEAVPLNDGIKVLHRLLDGSYHIQTIGQPAKKLRVLLYAGIDGVEKINCAEATGAIIYVFVRGKLRKGRVEYPVEWNKEAYNYYAGELMLLVEVEEGS